MFEFLKVLYYIIWPFMPFILGWCVYLDIKHSSHDKEKIKRRDMNKIEFAEKLKDMYSSVGVATFFCGCFGLLSLNSGAFAPPTNYNFDEYKSHVIIHKEIKDAEIKVDFIDKKIVNEGGLEKNLYTYKIGGDHSNEYEGNIIKRNEPLFEGENEYYISGKREEIRITYPNGSDESNHFSDREIFPSSYELYFYDIYEFEGHIAKEKNIDLSDFETHISIKYDVYRNNVDEASLYFIVFNVLAILAFLPIIGYLIIFIFVFNKKNKYNVKSMKYKWFGDTVLNFLIFFVYVIGIAFYLYIR